MKAVKESYAKYKEKTVSTKVVLTFLTLMLTARTTYKEWALYVPCVQYVLHPMQTPLWQILKRNKSIHTLKRCLCFTLKILIKDLNEKHKTIKFNFQISPRNIAFLDAMFYTMTKITTSKHLYCKPTDQHAFLHAKGPCIYDIQEKYPILAPPFFCLSEWIRIG